MNIQTTKDYSQFKLIDENRVVASKQVKNLMESLDDENLMEFHPVIVNKDMEIIDGQHRVEAAKRMNLPVYYIVADKANIDSVRRLNNYTRRWTLLDYVDSYAKGGIEAYRILRKFIQKHDLAVSPVVELFALNTSSTSKQRQSVRDGSFDVRGLKSAQRIIGIAELIQKHGQPTMWRHKSFIRSVIKIVRNPEFKDEIFTKKIAEAVKSGGRGPFIFHNQVDTKNFLREFEEIYNFGMKTNITRFF